MMSTVLPLTLTVFVSMALAWPFRAMARVLLQTTRMLVNCAVVARALWSVTTLTSAGLPAFTAVMAHEVAAQPDDDLTATAAFNTRSNDRREGMPELEVPDDADPQTRLLAFIGRTA